VSDPVSDSIEETTRFEPRFGPDGLMAAIVADAASSEVLMFAWMNAEALALTLETGQVHFWSRSRRRLWRKGESSGEVLAVIEVLTDCDQDALLVRVEPKGLGAACHTGRRSCFYRALDPDSPGTLVLRNANRLLDLSKVYAQERLKR
jgi:phosphoribosyl-AMP cyclohydrolase